MDNKISIDLAGLKEQLNRIWLDEKGAARLRGESISQQAVSDRLGVSQGAFSQFLNARNTKAPPFEFQLKLCLLFDRDITDLHPKLKALATGGLQ